MRVRVFRNLTRRCLSIQARVGRSWRTVAHAEDVVLSDVRCRVSEAGRQRVLRTGRKVVHAWLEGKLEAWTGRTRWPAGAPDGADVMVHLTSAPPVLAMHTPPACQAFRLSYNPRKAPTFVVPSAHGCGLATVGASVVHLSADGCKAWAPTVDLFEARRAVTKGA